MSLFLTMFGASALATILFAPKNTQDDSSEFDRLNEGINKLDGKLDSLLDVSAFLKARSCLTEFSIRLIGSPTVSYAHHSIDDIMAAAKAGFDKLLEIAKADDNNFIAARTIFAKTYGNADWVSAQFGSQVDAYEQLDTIINNYSVKLLSLVNTEVRYDNALMALKRTYIQYKTLGWFRFKKRRDVQKRLFEIQRVLITISHEFVAKAQLDLDDYELYILFWLVRADKDHKDSWARKYLEYTAVKRNNEPDGSHSLPIIPCSCSVYDVKTCFYISDYNGPWFRLMPTTIQIETSHRKLFNMLLSDKTITRKHFRA